MLSSYFNNIIFSRDSFNSTRKGRFTVIEGPHLLPKVSNIDAHHFTGHRVSPHGLLISRYKTNSILISGIGKLFILKLRALPRFPSHGPKLVSFPSFSVIWCYMLIPSWSNIIGPVSPVFLKRFTTLQQSSHNIIIHAT